MKTETLRKQALSHFKKVKDSKINKNRILNILNNVSHTVDFNDIRFGNGYFIFTFAENSIAWFFMKEFPEWKFAIWLNEDNEDYSIFGEAITLIDKFKPSYSTLSFENVIDFNNELPKILNNEGRWKEYNENVKHGIKQDQLSDEFNKRAFDNISKYIKKVESEFENNKVDTYIKIVDRNTNDFRCSPRYKLNEFTDIEGYFKTEKSFERSRKLFIDMCNLMEYNSQNDGNYEREFYLDIDDFLFENLCIENPKDYEDKAKLYKWDEDKTFEEFVKKLN